MLRFLKTKLGRVAALAVALIAAYAIVGFVVVPRLLRNALLTDLPKTLQVAPSVGDIRFNPFLLRLSVDDFALRGPGGGPLLGFKRLFVAFELSSLWHRAYSFGEIDLSAPYVDAAVAADGSLNLLRLVAQSPPSPAPATSAPEPATRESIPAVRIGSFKVSQGLVSYEDHSHRDEFAARLEPIDFELRDFTTGVAGGEFSFSGVSKQGERLDWRGHLGVQPIESTGELRVRALRVQMLWEYFQDQLNFTVTSGTIDLDASYRFSGGNLQVDVANVSLDALGVRPRNGSTDWVSLPHLRITGAHADVAEHRVHVDAVVVDSLKLMAWLEPDGSLNLAQLAPRAAPAAPGPAAATMSAAPSGPAPSGSAVGGSLPVKSAAGAVPWQFDLKQFELHEASLALEDRTTQPSAKLLLAPLNINVSDISQDLAKPVSVQVDTHLNEAGVLSVSGQVTPDPLLADVTVKLDAVDLTAIQPYLARASGLTLLTGVLGGTLTVHVGAAKNSPATQIAGDLRVDHFHSVDDALHEDFVDWDRLDVSGLNYSQGPDRLRIAQITARKPYVRAIVESDDSMNFKRVMMAPGAAATAAVAATAAAAATPVGAKSAGPQPAGAKSAAKSAAAPAAGQRGLPLDIKKIVVEDGQANFADLSVVPHFSSGINKLGGSIVNVSSKPGSLATLDLHGQVAAFSPVAITGQFNVLGPKLYTDVNISFRNISLPIFNPYSGKFAGYDITEGKLSTEFHYKVDGRQLDAQHHVVIEQLQFGEKTDSKEAVSLPIKLAVALLKDRNGVIDLSLPVTGTLDDPQFRLGALIWKVCVNILEKAVTAPFALLGSLFGAGPDLQYIDFEPGVSDLDAAALEKAKAVAKALAERPALSIEVPIAVVADVDRPALVAAEFKARLRAAQVAAKLGTQPFDSLPAATQLDVLTRLYSQEFGVSPKLPSGTPAAKLAFLGHAIREHIQVGDNDLKSLGQRRAKALQQALLADSEVPVDRVFLVSNDKASANEGLVRLELTLK
jgi:hypothetical protein